MRYVGAIVAAGVLICVVLGLSGSHAPDPRDWWPEGPAMRELPKEIIDIPDIDDPELQDAMRRLAREVHAEPTTRANVGPRADLVRSYYNALQADGVMVPWIGLVLTNALEGFESLGDATFARWAATLDGLVHGLLFVHEHRGELGSIEIIEPRSGELTAREFTTLRLRYRVGALGLRPGSQIRFGQHWYTDASIAQLSRPLHAGYTSVTPSDPTVRLGSGFSGWQSVWSVLQSPKPRPLVTVLEGALEEGDTIDFVLGDRSGGGPGLLIQSYTSDAMTLRFEVDVHGDGLFVPVGMPRFLVHGQGPHHVRAVAPGTVREGEPVVVRAVVEDRYFNRAVGGPGQLELWWNGQRLATAESRDRDPSVFEFPPVGWPDDETDTARFEVRDRAGRLHGRSNPVWRRQAGADQIYWGELHGHEGYTDGSGSAEWFLRYARDVAVLDFAALTGHDLMMSEVFQRDVQRATRKYNEPGRFVTFKSYEWTQQTEDGGHHNVFYRDDEQRIIPLDEAPTITDLYRLQREVNDPDAVLIIPHCHEPGDWRFNDAQLERLVEIYSAHGSFEWFGQRYLERGFRVGLMAASDDHLGHPGNSPVRIATRGGLTAVWAPEKTRGALFDAMVDRRVYGTSLARILLDLEVAGAEMGSEVAARKGTQVVARGRVSGTAPIARVVAVSDGREVAVEDYLAATADSDGPAALRVMLGNSSEPPDEGVLPPLVAERWWGRVLLSDGRLVAVSPLGLDGYSDTYRQVHGRRIDFSCTVRGDEDGFLLELEEWPDELTVTVELYTRPYADLELWHQDEAMPLWGEGSYANTELVARVAVPASELTAGVVERAISERTAVLIERVGGELALDREFALDISDAVRPEGESYVYVRVEQIDNEVAWSSPVWITWVQ